MLFLMVSSPSLPPSRPADGTTVLAFDFGLKRIGVAVGERLLGRARALTTIEADIKAIFRRLDRCHEPTYVAHGRRETDHDD